MKRTICCLLSLILYPSLVLADGGTLRLSQRSGDYQVSVFTSPAALRTGPLDISVLVQDAGAGAVRSDVPVSIAISPSEQPALMTRAAATTSAATNKLFRAALFDVPRPGNWTATIVVGESAAGFQPRSLAFDFDVAPPPPAWLNLAPWVGWPLIVAGLFVWHQRLASRREIRTRLAAATFKSTLSVPWAGTSA